MGVRRPAVGRRRGQGGRARCPVVVGVPKVVGAVAASVSVVAFFAHGPV